MKTQFENFSLQELQQHIITKALEIGAIKICPTEPFTWASGYRMPIYNDNRMLLAHPETRAMVVAGLHRLLKNEGIQPEWIAGTATAGIPWGAILAHEIDLPFAYIRDEAKKHGLKNRIEGLDNDKDFDGAKVVVVEDLISTGNSSANAVKATQEANGNIYSCLSIFNYGFPEVQKLFANLTPPCMVQSLITYPMLLEAAVKVNYLQSGQIDILKDWSESPLEWGAKHGFPKEEKKQLLTKQKRSKKIMTYLEQLEKSARKTGSIVCMGLDLVVNQLPFIRRGNSDGIKGFLPFVQDLLKEMTDRNIHCSAFKPNQGFYAIHESAGYTALNNILDCLETFSNHSKTPVILDYKRGDIGPSSANYAIEGFDCCGAHMATAVTISPYMGTDSVEPFLQYCLSKNRGVYILNRTSNKGAADFQNLKLFDGKFLFEAVAEKIIEWSETYPGTGAVVGATSLEELYTLAKMYAPHNVPLLIPGVGKQGGSAKEVVAVLREAEYPLCLARINSSSGLTHPWAAKKQEAPTNYAEVCINELQKLNEEIGPIF